MTAHEYAEQFKGFPNYYTIAIKAFRAGQKNAKPLNVQKLENDLKKAKKELKELWDALEDPEKCGELIAGL